MAHTVVGFDLDMTLIDSRPGIRAVYDELAAETGVAIDSELVVSRLGPPLEIEMAHWFAPDEVAAAGDRYRAMYPAIALPLIEAMPGAHAAVEAANASGRTIVVTAKHPPNARLYLERLGIAVTEVFGDVWRQGKADVLVAESADVYVGDHVHDMEAATLAGIVGIGVATGPCSREELAAAGARIVIDSLARLPEELARM